jgi:hypothetical protein
VVKNCIQDHLMSQTDLNDGVDAKRLLTTTSNLKCSLIHLPDFEKRKKIKPR